VDGGLFLYNFAIERMRAMDELILDDDLFFCGDDAPESEK